MPKFSIIVPVYNVEAYLSRCIDSILAQSYTDFELILVDDESSDRCPIICDEYARKDHRIRVIHKINGGVSSARNAGLDIATGRYVAFCDSDDSFSTNLLQTASPILDSGADCIAFNYTTCTDSAVIKQTKFIPGDFFLRSVSDRLGFLFKIVLQHKQGFEVCDHIFTRKIIEEHHIRFCTDCNNFAEDLAFVVSYTLHSQHVHSLPDSYYNYYVRENSMMARSRNILRFNDMNEAAYFAIQHFRTLPEYKDVQKQESILHYMFMYQQYQKLINTQNYKLIPYEAKKIAKYTWYRYETRGLLRCRKLLQMHFGKNDMRRIIILARFCSHGNWKLFQLELKLFYKLFWKR